MDKAKVASIVSKGLTFIFLGAGIFSVGWYMGSKYERKIIAEERETAEELAKRKEEKLKKELDEANTKLNDLKEVDEAIDMINEHIKKEQNMEIDYPIEEEGDYPMTEKEITLHNELYDMYGFLSFTTEEEMDNLYPEYDKVDAALYSDGKLADRGTGQYLEPLDEHVGNLISGMGVDDPVRFIHNESLEMDIKVTYIDHEADLPIYDDEEVVSK